MPTAPTRPDHPTQHVLHQQLIASDVARTQLRDSLFSYLRTLPDQHRTDIEGVATPADVWACRATSVTATASQPTSPLLVGTPQDLAAALQDLARCCHELSSACHAPAPGLQSVPHPLFTDRLDWIRNLAVPISTPPPGTDDIPDTMRLLPNLPEAPEDRRAAAFRLARDLPYFNRALTAYYLAGAATTEYELHVAHSVLRLAPHDITLHAFLTELFPCWRSQGLLHVLTVASVHMPSADRDWGLPSAPGVQTLLHALALARSCQAVVRAVNDYMAPNTLDTHRERAAFAITLDSIAALMRVKSNAPRDDPESHSLDHAIAAHLPRPDEWTDGQASLTPALLTSIWTRVKPALEKALPPSMLLAGGEYW